VRQIEKILGDMCKEFLNLVGKSYTELLSLFLCDISEDDDYYDVIACNIAINFPGRLEMLLDDLSGQRLRGAICGLGLAEIRGSADRIKTYLTHGDERIVNVAIVALSRVGVPGDWSLIKPSLNHSSPYVRGAALRFARAMLGLGAKPILVDALKDKSGAVRWIALDELDGLATNELAGVVEQLLSDPDSEVRDAAESLLASIRSI